MNACDQDHADMEARPGGGGGVVAVLIFTLAIAAIVATSVWLVNAYDQWQHDHAARTLENGG